MSLFLPFLLLFPLLLLLLLTQKIKQDNRPYKLPPSPPMLPIIGNLHQLGKLPHRSLWNLSKQYGPIMLLRFGRKPTLVVSSSQAAKELLKIHDLHFCSRPVTVSTRRLSYNFADIAFAPYGDYWREMRKICVLELLSMKRVQSFRFVREEEVALMINSISQSLSCSSPVNLSKKLFSMTVDIISRTAFGKIYQGRDFDGGRFQQVVVEALDMMGSSFAADFIPCIGWIVDVLTGLHGRLEKSFHELDTFYQHVIDEHLDPKRTKPEQEDIIDVLLGLQTPSLIHHTKDQIKAILMNIFLGGVDTNAVTMIWAMAELVRNPKIMKQVQEEIRSYVGKKGKVEERDLDKLEYLKMVVKETLRLHPPGPLLIPRESMHHCEINGYEVPQKTRILVNAWAIGRNSEYWENPDDFFPGRFMNSSIDFRGQHFEYLPFGAGRRSCPAMTMGIVTVELALANLLYCFDWEFPIGMKKEDISMDEVAGLVVHKKSALQLVPIKYNWESTIQNIS